MEKKEIEKSPTDNLIENLIKTKIMKNHISQPGEIIKDIDTFLFKLRKTDMVPLLLKFDKIASQYIIKDPRGNSIAIVISFEDNFQKLQLRFENESDCLILSKYPDLYQYLVSEKIIY